MRLLSGDPEIYREIWIREDYPLKNLARGKTVADVGAHIGLFTIYALLRLGAKEVSAFEPRKENLALLLRNVRINGLESRVQLHEVALTGLEADREPGVPAVPDQEKVHDTNWTSLGIPTVGPEALYGCQVLKLDCEGAELPILTSFPSDRLQEVEAIVLEYHLDHYGMEGLKTILDRLDGSGLSCTISPHKDPRNGIIKAVR